MTIKGVRLGALLAGLLGLIVPSGAAAVCSPYAGGATSGPVTAKVAINEYNYSAGYIELKIRDPNVQAATNNFQNWVLSVHKGASNRTDYSVAAALGSCVNAPEYLKFSTGNLGNDSVVVLWSDASRTQEVDYLRVGQNAYPGFQATTCFAGSEVPATSARTYHQAELLGSSARKDVARAPDGFGAWLETPYVGANQGTSCGSNDGTLSIAKTLTSTNASDWIGNNVSFRITAALDGNASTQSSVTVTDLLPAGFSLLGASPSVGSYAPETGVWTIGSLDPNGSAVLDLVAKLVEPGVLTNTARVQSTDFPAGSVDAASASATSLIPTVGNVVAPSLVPLNSDATFTITVANPSLTLSAPAFSLSNVLSGGLSFVSAATGTGSFAGAGSGTWSIPSLAPGASATLTVLAKVTQTGAQTGTAQVNLNGFSPLSASAVATVTGAPPNAFNAWINPATRTIPTQLVGSVIGLTVGYFDPAGNPDNYSGEVGLALEYCTNVVRPSAGSISCGGAWAALVGSEATASFGGTSTVAVNLPAAANAYEIVRVRISPAAGGSFYAADYFAVRPAALSIAASDADWTTAGTSNSLLAPGANKHKAGRPFTVALGSGASNYPGSTLLSVAGPTPTVSVAAGLTPGVFTPGAWSASAGGMSSNSAAYSEVGAFTLLLEDQHYADIDAADSTPAQRYVSGSANLQRFVPDVLRTSLTPPCGPFMYSTQPLAVTVAAYAYNSAAPTLTANYAAFPLPSPTYSQDVTLSNAGDSAGFSNPSLAGTLFAAGQATDSDVYFTLPGVETSPQTLVLRAVDADGVSSQGGVEASIEIRSGRVRIGNAYGSALLPLLLPVTVEYFKSAAERWVRNDAHACTTTLAAVPASANAGLLFVAEGGKNRLSAGEVAADIGGLTAGPATLAFVAGRSAIKLRSPAAAAAGPGAANYGFVDLDLSPVALGWPAWLPPAGRGRADFGIYKSTRFIYRREVR